ncbi:hypothetical protein C0584_02070 [Candidatus Parcubacteria bacterium]|nr:MAG: hypothetical protein C0584_02070 [Candidatus Parcubacteria bacterium]
MGNPFNVFLAILAMCFILFWMIRIVFFSVPHKRNKKTRVEKIVSLKNCPSISKEELSRRLSSYPDHIEVKMVNKLESAFRPVYSLAPDSIIYSLNFLIRIGSDSYLFRIFNDHECPSVDLNTVRAISESAKKHEHKARKMIQEVVSFLFENSEKIILSKEIREVVNS